MAGRNSTPSSVVKELVKKYKWHIYKKEKKMLLDKLDEMDKKAESTPLNPNELNLKHVMKWYHKEQKLQGY